MNLFRTKPKTLGEVVRRVSAGEQKFDPCLREFLDSFYLDKETATAGNRGKAGFDRCGA